MVGYHIGDSVPFLPILMGGTRFFFTHFSIVGTVPTSQCTKGIPSSTRSLSRCFQKFANCHYLRMDLTLELQLYTDDSQINTALAATEHSNRSDCLLYCNAVGRR